MKATSILFVNLPGTPYTELADRLSVDNKGSYRKYGISGKSLPLGMLYLSSYIKAKFQTSLEQYIADYFEKLETIEDYDSVDDFIRDVAVKSISTPPDIVAISIMFATSYKFFKNLLSIYKSLWPNSIFIVGGIHATNTAGHILQTTDIDYVFRGESEIALYKFIKNYREKIRQHIPGVYTKSDISQDMNQICELVTNLDELPFPNLELVNVSSYLNATKIFRAYQDLDKGVIELVGSRGCPYKCTFCSGHSSNNRNVRFRTVENIMAEIKELYKRYGVVRFVFNDDLIVANATRFFKITNAFRDSSISGLEFQSSGLDCRSATSEMIDAISGTSDVVLIAVDSGSQYIQKHIIKKNVNLERVKEVVGYSHKKGLIVRCNFIFGFPNETKELMDDAAEYMRSLNADWYQIFTAVPFVGTELYDQFVKMGILNKYDEELWESCHYGVRSFDTDTCTADELNNFTYSLNLELNFVNNYNLRTGQYDRAIVMFKELLSNYPFHIFGQIALYQAYKGLGDSENSLKVKEQINKTMAENGSSREMYEKHRNLLKNTEFYNISLIVNQKIKFNTKVM